MFKLSSIAALVSSALLVTVHASPASFAERATPLAQIISSCTNPNNVALTFDDGPWLYTQKISDALVAAGAKGTFFWNGNNYGCIYDEANVERVKYAYNAGHQVASHTWAHKDLATLSQDQINSEMSLLEQALQRILGVTPAFMRPPYGSYNDLVRQVAYTRGQNLALWDFDSGDSTGSSPAQSEAAYDQIISRHPSNILALNHEVYEGTADEVIPYAISKLQASGYNLVTLAECIGMAPYQSIVPPQSRSASWTC